MQKILLVLISLYKAYFSSVLPASCRFYPTCSEYARESIERYGAFRGFLKALGRILRCHPLNHGGYNPVK